MTGELALDEKTVKTIKIIGIALLVALAIFLLIKFGGPIIEALKGLFEKLGLSQTKADKEVEKLKDEGYKEEGNPWNPNTWLSVPVQSNWVLEWFPDEIPGQDETGYRKVPYKSQKVVDIFREIEDCFGIINDDEQKIIGIIKNNFKTKVSFSYFVYMLLWWSDIDFLEYLQGEAGISNDRLSNEEIAIIIHYLEDLPLL